MPPIVCLAHSAAIASAKVGNVVMPGSNHDSLRSALVPLVTVSARVWRLWFMVSSRSLPILFCIMPSQFMKCITFVPLMAMFAPAVLAAELTIEIGYLGQVREREPVLSNLVAWPDDEGEPGALLAIEDNNTTGKFLKHQYELDVQRMTVDDDVVAAASNMLSGGPKLLVLNVTAESMKKIAALPEAADDLLFNAGSSARVLRGEGCQANVLHTLPSRAMYADALMQFFNKRKWTDLFLLAGNRPGDVAYADALRSSARKFGLKIRHDKQWLVDADIRRNASSEVPVLTQERKYDVLLVTDEDQDFSNYLLYHTWLPRPVAGSAGLRAVAWDRVVEQWGAAQLQSRWSEISDREMRGVDYAAWAAVRSIGEAVTRTQSTDVATLRTYLLGPDFSLAGFKGAKLSYRSWNGQLRQPIPLVHANAVVAQAPIEGFLHRVTELDTLGLDEPESTCQSFNP